jgi:predicted nucleic acid-binding protein
LTRGLTLDTGALIAYERGDRRMRVLVAAAERDEGPLSVPSVVIVEAWRGGNARWLAALLGASIIEPLTEHLAKRAGELLARTQTSNAVDAIVAASAAQRSDVIVTSDPGDLQRLADDLAAVRVWAI